jgi:hypothetical protein
MNRLPVFLIVMCCVVSRPLGVRASEAPLGIPAEGEPFRGQLAAADAAWKLRFVDAGAARAISADDLALWGAFVEPAGGIQVILAGGGWIAVETARIEKEQVRAQSQTFGELNLPIERIAGIMYQPPHDLAKRDRLIARMLAPGGQSDRLLLDNGDELSGAVTGSKEEKMLLQNEAGQTDVKIDKLTAILFNPTLTDQSRPSGLRCWVGFRDGSRLMAIELTATPDTARLKLPGGVEVNAPTKTVVALQSLGGRVVYLSDLKPASYRHIPFLQLTWPFQADRSVLGSQLRSGGRPYAKGLGMHSPARITYDLDRPYRRFQAEVAIDGEAGPRGSVVFRVFTDDGSGVWQQRATSEIIRGGELPTPITIDLTAAKRISLLVDYADHGDELDHADWLNARLVR